MSILNLEIYGSRVLRQKSKSICQITPEIVALGKDMIETMYANNGIGLAGVQVGKNLRLFAIDTHFPKQIEYKSEGEKALSPLMPLVIVNPEILDYSKEKSSMNEGCLSVPQLNADVVRPDKILLKGKVLGGQDFIYWCDGLLSRCAQHEIDHLNGIIFTDISEEKSLQLIAEKLKKLEKENSKSSK